VTATLSAAAGGIVSLHGRDLLPVPELLGCGAFGCVLPTSNPDWVCKVSIEGSEAFFAGAQAITQLWPKGVCEYLEPLRVRSPAGPIWIMWKSAVEEPTFHAWYYAHNRPPKELEDEWDFGDLPLEEMIRRRRKWEKDRGLDAFDLLHEVQQSGMTVAMGFSDHLLRGAHPTEFARVLRSRQREASRMFRPRKRGIDWFYTDEDVWKDRDLHAAVRLMAYEWHLERLRGNILLGPFAKAALTYLARGLVLGDCQADNFGKSKGVWTLFDAGFCVPVHSRWAETWEGEKIDTALWSATDRGRFWERLQGGR